MSPRMKAGSILFVVLLTAALLGPRPGASQVRVLVIDSLSGLPVPGASVQLLDAEGLILIGSVSSQSGVAVLQNQDLAPTLRVIALGYESWTGPITDRPIARLVPDALRVDPIRVEVDSRSGLVQFRRRSQEYSGVFLDPAEVYLKSKYGVSGIFMGLREEGVRLSIGQLSWRRRIPLPVTNVGSGCLNYRLNNLPVREPDWDEYPLDALLPKDLMAVEIYRYFGEVPPELRHNAGVDGRTCGLVVIWTTEAWRAG